jgi:hypothetical protein
MHWSSPCLTENKILTFRQSRKLWHKLSITSADRPQAEIEGLHKELSDAEALIADMQVRL